MNFRSERETVRSGGLSTFGSINFIKMYNGGQQRAHILETMKVM
jgi:hypothetical protein